MSRSVVPLQLVSVVMSKGYMLATKSLETCWLGLPFIGMTGHSFCWILKQVSWLYLSGENSSLYTGKDGPTPHHIYACTSFRAAQ